MRPVLLCQYLATNGPGLLGELLAEQGVPVELFRSYADDPLPSSPERYCGLVAMGGIESANDDLPWIEPQLMLMRECDRRGVPVIGHCLGGQLLSRALGGTVRRAPQPEFGFHAVRSAANDIAREWLGLAEEPIECEVMQWHEDVFEPPPGSIPLLEGSAAFPHQGFVTPGGSVGLQCHIEVDAGMVRTWIETSRTHPEPTRSAQPIEVVLEGLTAKVAASRAFAIRLYRRWMEGLAR
jgi:GMP synthase-like glutamine amidotransferase